jgi:hypothetical protein
MGWAYGKVGRVKECVIEFWWIKRLGIVRSKRK